jgi:hypothetical protein
MFQLGTSTRVAEARRRVGQFRRVEKAPLHRARHPVHRTYSNCPGLSAGLELGHDDPQKRATLLLIDRRA